MKVGDGNRNQLGLCAKTARPHFPLLATYEALLVGDQVIP